jgi:DNA-binding NarL/FixJ family response regulator
MNQSPIPNMNSSEVVPASLSILVVEDQVMLSKLFTDYLAKLPFSEKVMAALNYRQAVEIFTASHFDLVFIDIHLRSDLNGFDLAILIKNTKPNTKIVFLTNETRPDFIRRAISLGASAYVEKDCGPDDLARTVRWVFNPENDQQVLIYPVHLRTQLFDEPMERPSDPKWKYYEKLTDAEKQVMEHLSEGKTVKEIAFALNKAATTIYTHQQNAKQKLKLHSHHELLRAAIDYVLLSKSKNGSSFR